MVADASQINFEDFLGSLANAQAVIKNVADVTDTDVILDVGPETAKAFADILKTSKTILWNGPVGVFEVDQFGEGTKVLSLAIAESAGFSIAGGGHLQRLINMLWRIKSVISQQVAVHSWNLLKAKLYLRLRFYWNVYKQYLIFDL